MDEDLYDFSGVTLDLQLLKSELMTIQNSRQNVPGSFSVKSCAQYDDDDEEWFPPSPPIYDVTEKLIEINRNFREDPTPIVREPNKLRWRPGPGLVQVSLFTSINFNNFFDTFYPVL